MVSPLEWRALIDLPELTLTPGETFRYVLTPGRMHPYECRRGTRYPGEVIYYPADEFVYPVGKYLEALQEYIDDEYRAFYTEPTGTPASPVVRFGDDGQITALRPGVAHWFAEVVLSPAHLLQGELFTDFSLWPEGADFMEPFDRPRELVRIVVAEAEQAEPDGPGDPDGPIIEGSSGADAEPVKIEPGGSYSITVDGKGNEIRSIDYKVEPLSPTANRSSQPDDPWQWWPGPVVDLDESPPAW